MNQTLQLPKLSAGESVASFQTYRIKPELRLRGVTLDMNVGRLALIRRVKEEPVRARSENCRQHC